MVWRSWKFQLSPLDFSKALGKAITKYRKEQRYSQEKLAEGTGMHPTAISHFETGKHSPTVSTLSKICKFLSIRLSELFIEAEKFAEENSPIKP